jgi:hypothetical protein
MRGSCIACMQAMSPVALEKLGGPRTIGATYTLNGVTTTFADLYQMNRPGLLLANGHIYIAWGSIGTHAYSEEWVLSYNATRCS